jgi:hypothetical protein
MFPLLGGHSWAVVYKTKISINYSSTRVKKTFSSKEECEDYIIFLRDKFEYFTKNSIPLEAVEIKKTFLR